jgi:hypothetical protein
VRLISFFGLVYAALLYSLPVSLLIPALRGLSQKWSVNFKNFKADEKYSGGSQPKLKSAQKPDSGRCILVNLMTSAQSCSGQNVHLSLHAVRPTE